MSDYEEKIKLGEEMMKRAEEYTKDTDAQRAKRKREVCKKCFYYAKFNSKAGGNCEYIVVTGHCRPCLPSECKEKGVFRPLNKRAKKVELKLRQQLKK